MKNDGVANSLEAVLNVELLDAYMMRCCMMSLKCPLHLMPRCEYSSKLADQMVGFLSLHLQWPWFMAKTLQPLVSIKGR